MTTLVVCLLTYKRTDYAVATLQSVLGHLQFGGSNDKLRLHIADDGSGKEHIDTLIGIVGGKLPLTITDSRRAGYGANYNLATQVVHGLADYVLFLEDDWELVRDFDAKDITNIIADLGDVACVRLGYVGFTQRLDATFVSTRVGHWLYLHPDSPEPHVFAGHPRIESVKWSRRAGEWPEGLLPGETEFRQAKNPLARQDVYWPLSHAHVSGDLFAHIGSERSY